MTPEKLSVQHSIERAASGLSKDGQLIAATAVTMVAEFATTVGESALEVCAEEGDGIVRLFLRQASELFAEMATAKACAGECGVAAHRDLIAIAPDGTRIRRETP